MGNEALPVEEIPAYLNPPEFDEHGSQPDWYLMEHYGVTSEEGRQIIKFGEHIGTLAKMLSEVPPKNEDGSPGKPCPVGGKVREAHANEGAEGSYKELDFAIKWSGADVIIKPKTDIDYERVGVIPPKKAESKKK